MLVLPLLTSLIPYVHVHISGLLQSWGDPCNYNSLHNKFNNSLISSNICTVGGDKIMYFELKLHSGSQNIMHNYKQHYLMRKKIKLLKNSSCDVFMHIIYRQMVTWRDLGDYL